MQNSRSAADIAVLYPSDTMMSAYEPQLKGGGGDLAQRSAESVRQAGSALFRAGHAFMFVDARSLAESKVRDNALVRGPLGWRVVILPYVTVLPKDAAERLEEFRRAGGLVLAVGVLPDNTTCEFPCPQLRRTTSAWTLLPDEGALPDRLLALGYRRTLEVVSGPADALRVAHRRSEEGDAFLVANDTREPWKGTVRVAGDPSLSVWDPRCGTCAAAKGLVDVDLPAYAAVVLTSETN